jgi:glycosyltransferase involved in cell wall biosynthesis
MKIIFVSKEYPPSSRSYGIGTYVWESSHALLAAGHEVTVVAASDDAITRTDTTVTGIRTIRLPDVEKRAPGPLTWRSIGTSRSLGLVYSARAYWKTRQLGIAYRTMVAETLEELIDEGSGDIVEFPGYRGESLVWADLPRRIPMVARVHGKTAWVHRCWGDSVFPRWRLINSWETKELVSADHVTVVASHLLPKVTKKVPGSRVSVIYNGIDTASWSNKRECPQTLINGEDILFVGSHVRAKGVFLLIEAARMLRASAGWSGRLVLAGRRGEEFESFAQHEWGASKNIPDWISLRGHCSRDLLPALYAGAGVCCLPSLNEGLNYTGLEAMASGAVVVGSSDGMGELVRPNGGFIVPAGNLKGLYHALKTALALDELSRQLIRSTAARAAREGFHRGVIAERSVDCYRSAILNFRPPGKRAGRDLVSKHAEG